ncbi:histidinol-phosphate aminotransferase [Candidatus Tenderia electrophaga]|uniref:Histidinol-phosphate aminotransferase n=1 Tax=Candidatus Tenderia electrophaga TaxID=1748243 RepID=A0A0S2TBH9_9GAMM|nr:histidinol-phosphate aminotransferase [Candidatus Tenderia electrophaga]
MSKYWSELTRGLVPYVPGEQPRVQDLIKLNTNENPYPPSPAVVAALDAFDKQRLRLYPDPNSNVLKQAVADYHGVTQRQVFVGNGSDEVLALAFMAFFKQSRPILFPDISYSFYPVYCSLFQIEYARPPLNPAFEIVLDDYPADNGGVIFPNPNAPTGRVLGLDELRRFLQRNTESAVIVDEAYIDFGGESAVALVNESPNLLVVQTLSKSRSLAGMRVGFAVGSAELIEGLERVKNSFNSYPLDMLAVSAAVAALQDRDYFEQTRQRIIASRDWLQAELQQLGFEVLPSAANFIFARHPRQDAARMFVALRQRKILVRHFNSPRIDQFLRITIGSQEQVEALVTALQDILG